MNKTAEETVKFIGRLEKLLGKQAAPSVWLAPAFVSLTEAAKALHWSKIKLAGQNMCEHESGAYTGEVSSSMLLTSGCAGVILGHSERRSLFSEDEDLIGRKVIRALLEKLTPIVCIGETAAERDNLQSAEVITRQLTRAFPPDADEGILDNRQEFAVAYEPIWAIGTGKVATPELAQEACKLIREWLEERFNKEIAAAAPILYGGSVKPENAAELLGQADIDGALVGGASLKVEDFFSIIKSSPDFAGKTTAEETV